MDKFRKELIEKVSKMKGYHFESKDDKIALFLTKSELRLVIIGLKALDCYENIIEEECDTE